MKHPIVAWITLFVVTVPAAVGCAPVQSETYDGVVEIHEMSETTKRALIDQQLLDEARGLGLESPPVVEIVRMVPLNEWLETTLSCMIDAGFPVKPTSDGTGLNYSAVPAGLVEQLNLAQYTCDAQYPVDPTYFAPMTDSQLQFLYWYFTGPLMTCLSKHGADVAAPPSYATFAESYNDPQTTWSPYAELTSSGSPAALGELLNACPQLPDQDELYPAG